MPLCLQAIQQPEVRHPAAESKQRLACMAWDSTMLSVCGGAGLAAACLQSLHVGQGHT